MPNDLEPKWKKADVILKPIGGLLTAVVIAIMGYWFNTTMNTQQARDSNVRLYTELISQRESAESALRKDMFTKVIGEFMKPETESLESKLLNLELLTYNFHESLNLKPLFMHQKRKIEEKRERDATKNDSLLTEDYYKRLEKVARENISKQLAGLETNGKNIFREIEWDYDKGLWDDSDPCRFYPGAELFKDTGLMRFDLDVEGITRTFKLSIIRIDTCAEEVKVALEITDPESIEPHKASFSVGFFDFPIIDNMRLSKDQRCAVILKEFDTEYSFAELSIIYFPGRYASLKERTYCQDIFDNLIRLNKDMQIKEDGI